MRPLGLAWQVLECVFLYMAAAFVGDIVHFALHAASKSRFDILRRVGALHEVHHRFLGADLRIAREYQARNLLLHRLPEYVTRVAAIAGGLLIFPRSIVLLAMATETVVFALGTLQGGIDSNHPAARPLRSRMGWLVGPAYHGYHHAFPENYMASMTTLFDVLFAKGCQIRGRRFVMTGASGAFGEPLAALLENAGGQLTRVKYGRDFDYEDYSRLDPALSAADVLVLCHGSKLVHAKEANCDSFVAIIERFRAMGSTRDLPVEVWAVGSEIEAHPAWGNPELEIYSRSKRAFATHARCYFHDPSIVYRHIVPSAYTSPMGKGLITGRTAALVAFFFIRRGFRYVPVTYTGIAFVNWLKFAWAGLTSGRTRQSGVPLAS